MGDLPLELERRKESAAYYQIWNILSFDCWQRGCVPISLLKAQPRTIEFGSHIQWYSQNTQGCENKKNIHNNLAMMTIMKMAITKNSFASFCWSCWQHMARLSNHFYTMFPFFTAHHSTIKTIFPPHSFPIWWNMFLSEQQKIDGPRGAQANLGPN